MNLDSRFLYDTYEALTRHPAPGDIKILCKNAPRCVKIRDTRSYPGVIESLRINKGSGEREKMRLAVLHHLDSEN